MTDEKCTCVEKKPEGSCPACEARDVPGYWCQTCERVVPDKRCPLCGLKTGKRRGKERGHEK